MQLATMSSDSVILLETVTLSAENHQDQRTKDPKETNYPIGVDQSLIRKENKPKTQRRGVKRCPVDGCQVTVIHLPRHLRQVHEWGRDEAQSAVNTFSLRAPSRHGGSSSKTKNDHPSRPCPMTGCHAVVRRLPAHLSKKHKLDKDSPLYRELLTASQRRRTKTNRSSCRPGAQQTHCFIPITPLSKQTEDLHISIYNVYGGEDLHIQEEVLPSSEESIDNKTPVTLENKPNNQFPTSEEVLLNSTDNKSLKAQNKLKTLNSKQKRGVKRCPVDGCQVTVIHLPRHLRQVHEWGREEAQSAVNTFGLRAPSRHGASSSKAKNDHPFRPCPMTGCHAVVKRLPAHLRKQHKLVKNSPLYRELLTASGRSKTNSYNMEIPKTNKTKPHKQTALEKVLFNSTYDKSPETMKTEELPICISNVSGGEDLHIPEEVSLSSEESTVNESPETLKNTPTALLSIQNEDLHISRDEDIHIPMDVFPSSEGSIDNESPISNENTPQNTPQIQSTSEEASFNLNSKKRRGVKRCPVDGCQVTVIHLPRHLRQVHEWGREEAQSAVNTFGLRAPSRHGGSSSKTKNDHPSRPCPMTGCHAVVKRLPAHLSK